MNQQSSQDVLIKIHKAFINFALRAEKADQNLLVDTFVDSAPLLDLMASINSQIIYGRRGTGKTHALKFIADSVHQKGEMPIYIDLRSVGSNTSIYNDSSRSLQERAAQLINDVLENILSFLYPIAVDALDTLGSAQQITTRLDDFQRALSSVKVTGTVENEVTTGANANKKETLGVSVSKNDGASLNFGIEKAAGNNMSHRTKTVGEEIIHIDFGNLQSALLGLMQVVGIKRLWLFIDEWSEIPVELQPYLADLIRRTFLPLNDVVVKIAAIEHRSQFAIRKTQGEYIGLELGADVSANLTLDDFLVFDSDENRSMQFFKQMIFKHFQASEQKDDTISSPDELIQIAFTQQNAFAEFVRAVEGVPRDALNLCTAIATKAFGKKISIADVADAALDWYQRDKAFAIRSKETLADTLQVIISEVIGKRRSRAFLFSSKYKNEKIEELFDARLLHILKKNISSKDEPGERYDVFKIDYGCYVSLRNTDRAPLGLFEVDDDDYVEVPKDDYRSIRRAILRPEMLSSEAKDVDNNAGTD